MKGKYLITTDNWFYAPDGLKYRAVWGEVKILNDDVLKIKTNARSTNWYAFIGSEEKGMVVAGCQVHYAVKSNKKPNTERVKDLSYNSSGASEFERNTEIYIAE